jgi:hypothetical protein
MRFRAGLAAALVFSVVPALTGVAPAEAAPGDKVFTIANYPVEAVAKDAVAAKEKAHADGQQAAFGALLKRLVPVTAYPRIDRLKTLPAANFIDGVAIRSETNSSTQYIASLDFAFQPDAIRDLLRREGVPFIEQQSPRVVLVPITAEAGDKDSARYRAAGGSWGQVWKGLDLDNTLTPLKIETLLPSIHDDTITAALNGDDSIERILTSEYNADYVLFAIAEVDAPGKQLNVTIAGIDAAGMLSWPRTYRIAEGDVAYAMDLAAVVTQGVLEGRWKVAKSEEGGRGTAGEAGAVQLAVEFSSLDEWNDLRRQLLDLPGVDDVRVGSVSARTADVSLNYPGGGPGLASALARQGVRMTNGGGFWTIRSGY